MRTLTDASRARGGRPWRSCRPTSGGARRAPRAARATAPCRCRAPRGARAARRGRASSSPARSSTNTHTRSPNVSSGIATAAHNATAGCDATSSSTCAALMFLPPRMMKSDVRPDDREVAVGVDRREVAHAHPAVGGEQLARWPRRRPSSRGTASGPCPRDTGRGRESASTSSSRTCISGITRPAVRSRFSCGSSGVVHDSAPVSF